MNSTLFSLKLNDFWKGAVTAVLAGVVAYLYGVFSAPDASIWAINWNQVITTAISALLGYLAKNWASTSDGKFLGTIG